MNYFDYLEEPQEQDYECSVCGKPMDRQGECSIQCFEASLR
jgi:hypothetical protein